MTILTETAQPVNTRLWPGAPTLNFGDDTYAEIHEGVVTIHKGQRQGLDTDWGGACIAAIELDKALAIAQAVLAMRQPSEADLMDADLEAIRLAGDCHPTQDDEDAWIEALAAQEDERREAMYDLVSAGHGHD